MQFKSLDIYGSKSLNLQLADVIENKIRNDELNIGQKLSTQKELSKIFKVSIETVNSAISHLVKEGYVSCRPRYGTFVINSHPKKGLNPERRNGICLVVCPSQDDNVEIKKTDLLPFIDKIIKGVEGKVSEKRAYLIFNIFRGEKLFFAGKENEIAGLIVTGTITPELYRIIKKSQIPFVLIGDVYQKEKTDADVDVICVDDFRTTYMATRHLIDLGHKRIAYFASYLDRHSFDKKLVEGYKEALKEAGIPFDKNLLITAGTGDEGIGYAVMKEFLDKSVPFTSLVCILGHLGIGTIRALGEKGMNIPRDISIVCIGAVPGLTSIVSDEIEMGKIAAERLVQRVANPGLQAERIFVPSILIDRNTTGQVKNSR